VAITITSFSPSSGSTEGGTSVVIVGTGLDTVDTVLFGNFEGAIDTTATNTSTSLTVIAPPIPAASAGTVKIILVDSVDGSEAVSSTSFTYSAASSPVQTTSLAKKWKFQCSSDGGTTYIDVKGVTNFQPAIAATTQDDSDYDSGDWGSDVVTQLKWSLVATVDRKTTSGYTEDPGQKALRLAAQQTGSAAVVYVRWYDRNGGLEAYSGVGNVQWNEKGGGTADKSTVDITVMGRGERTTIANPAA